MAEGMTNRQIGKEIGISSKTVEYHVSEILWKLRARNRAHAVAKWMRREGEVEVPEMTNMVMVQEMYRGSVSRVTFQCEKCDGETDSEALYCPRCGRRFRPGYRRVEVTR